ncbi:50S ribosomal protein L23 [soil metagenome]
MKTPLAPHITEKAYALISEEKGIANHYTFKVARTLRKEHIKAMIEREFSVTVTNIRTINLPGKVRIFKGKAGHTQATKKAIVRLKVGDKIAAFDQPTTEETK